MELKDRTEALRGEASTSVQFTSVFTAVTGLLLSFVLLRQEFSNFRTGLPFLVVAFVAFLFATLFYANASGLLSRSPAEDVRRASKGMQYGNIASEFFGVYPLVVALPLLILAIAPGITYLPWVALGITLASFLVYTFSDLDILSRFLGRKRRYLASSLLVPLAALFFLNDLFSFPILWYYCLNALFFLYLIGIAYLTGTHKEFWLERFHLLERREMEAPYFQDGKLNFKCLRGKCPKPCCGPFAGVSGDFESLLGRRFHEILLTTEDANLIRRFVGPERFRRLVVQHEEAGEREYAIKLKEDMSCPFWKYNGECEINLVKPAVCRAFPLYVDMFTGLCIIKTCPGVGQGWTTPEETQRMLDALSEVYNMHLKGRVARRTLASVFAGFGETRD